VLNAFNKVAALIGTQTDSDPASQNTGDKLGSGVVLGIQRRLQQLISTEVSTTGPVRTLRDLGVSLQKDGTLKLDASALNTALAKDPDACNAVFSKPTSGLSALVDAFVKGQTNAGTGTQMGALVARKNGLDANNKQLTRQADALQTHLDAYRRQLNIQFTALEQVMSGINSTARFLDAQSAQLNKK
jgi:flagellar hook-associated protein 2